MNKKGIEDRINSNACNVKFSGKPEKYRKMEIVFRSPMDTEEVRECIEDNMHVEILEINTGRE